MWESCQQLLEVKADLVLCLYWQMELVVRMVIDEGDKASLSTERGGWNADHIGVQKVPVLFS